MMRFAQTEIRVVLLCFLFLAACDDDASVAAAEGRLVLSASTIDFGEVQVGTSSNERTVLFSNSGNAAIRLTGVVPGQPFDAEAFEFVFEDFDLPPNGTAPLRATFTPRGLGEQTSVIVIRATIAGEEVERTISLVGEGVTSRVTATPRVVSFGNVRVETEKMLPVQVTNNSSFVADIEYLGGANIALCGARDASAFCLRAVDRNFIDDQKFRLGPSESLDLELVFRPSVTNTQERSVFGLRYCPQAVCELEVALSGFSVERGFACEPQTLDFGAVNPGECRELEVLCSNIANEIVTVTDWKIANASSAEFEVDRPQSAVLQPASPTQAGGTLGIPVRYCPRELGDDEGRLTVTIDDADPSRAQTLVELTGSGGGPDIDVLPKQINFGLVSLLAPARRSVLITNTGFEDLQINEIVVDSAGTGAFRSEAAGADIIAPGESSTLPIDFRPSTEGQIETRLVIRSDDRDEAEVEVLLRGEGINLPPCEFDVSSDVLNYGTVQATRSARGAFEIRNLSASSACLVNSVGLRPGSDSAFSLPESYDSVLIPPEAALVVSAAFVPERVGTYQGTIDFSISNPQDPFNSVELVGQAADGTLLIVPNDLFYGTVEVGCASRTKTVTIYNTSAVGATIDSVSVVTQPGVFEVTGLPDVPFAIQPGESVELGVAFFAPKASGYAGSIELTGTFENQPVTYVISMQGRGAVDAVQSDRFVQLGKPKVDILFVVDNSCSMGPEQQSLADNFESFIEFAEAQALDFHIAVTTTDVQVERGRFVPITGPASERIVTPRTQPSPEDVFVDNVVLGTSGGIPESGLEAAYLALSNPLILGHNSGFLRREAVLSLIFVSDEADGSSRAVDFYSNFFRSIKGFRNTNLFSASAILATEGGGCVGPRAPWDALRYQTVQEATGGLFGDICTSDWGRTLEELSGTAFGFKSRFFMSNQPVIETVEVFVDDVRLPSSEPTGRRNWSYDFPTNAIDFAPIVVPEPGASIRVEYSSQCL